MTDRTEIENAHDKLQVASDERSEADLSSNYSKSTGRKEITRNEVWYIFGKYYEYSDKNEAENNDKKIRKSARNTYIQKLYEAEVTVKEARIKFAAMCTKLETMRTELEQYNKTEEREKRERDPLSASEDSVQNK
jgi:hypothetical protein